MNQPESSFSARRINKLAAALNSCNYVEIGVLQGVTFREVRIRNKHAVDPHFLFDISGLANASTHFYQMTSDAFFTSLDVNAQFDQFFIDGLHHFEQVLRDFNNALAHSHNKTVFLIDDTKPYDVFSAERDQQEALRLRAAFGESGNLLWHGDVFKLVFYIHDFCPSFDYCTIVESGNPQTLVWKAKESLPRLPLFDSLERISRMSFIDLLQNFGALKECVEEDAVSRCVSNLLSR